LVGGTSSIRAPFVDPVVRSTYPRAAQPSRRKRSPVVVINTVADVNEAVAKANATRFGLGSSVFSEKHGQEIAQRLKAVGTTMNSVLTFVGMPSFPFGGINDSGCGRFHGDDGLRESPPPRPRPGGQDRGLPAVPPYGPRRVD
jgi:succinate-semialdehyde dehydrogenase/glutarate-semialdehyde dehydrogenase